MGDLCKSLNVQVKCFGKKISLEEVGGNYKKQQQKLTFEIGISKFFETIMAHYS